MATQEKIEKMTIVECPRDAMQGLSQFIPTKDKISYLNSLLEVGFDILDFGSFVSAKAIPQLADTIEVLENLNWEESSTELLGIVAGRRGISEAAPLKAVKHLGFPFSISETFQKRNTQKTIEDSFGTVQFLLEKIDKHNKEAVLYLSMGFGNPYEDPWSISLVEDWCGKLIENGVKLISLSDTVGQAEPKRFEEVYLAVKKLFPETEFGIHMHTRYDNWRDKMESAWNAGCRRFDGAIKGFGGCPFAEDVLVGNLPTEKILSFCTEKNIENSVNIHRFQSAYNQASEIFSAH